MHVCAIYSRSFFMPCTVLQRNNHRCPFLPRPHASSSAYIMNQPKLQYVKGKRVPFIWATSFPKRAVCHSVDSTKGFLPFLKISSRERYVASSIAWECRTAELSSECTLATLLSVLRKKVHVAFPDEGKFATTVSCIKWSHCDVRSAQWCASALLRETVLSGTLRRRSPFKGYANALERMQCESNGGRERALLSVDCQLVLRSDARLTAAISCVLPWRTSLGCL